MTLPTFQTFDAFDNIVTPYAGSTPQTCYGHN